MSKVEINGEITIKKEFFDGLRLYLQGIHTWIRKLIMSYGVKTGIPIENCNCNQIKTVLLYYINMWLRIR